MRSRGTRALCALVMVLVPLALAAQAHAGNQTPGATYTGTFWGTWDGATYSDPIAGTVEFDVSADGTQVTRFEVTDIAAGHAFAGPLTDCLPMDAVWTDPVAIDDDPSTFPDGAFFQPNGTDFTFDGYFDAPSEASGRVQVVQQQNGTNCYTGGDQPGNVFWTATTGGGCEASPQYIDLKATVAELKAQAAAAKVTYDKAKAKNDKAVKKVKKARAARNAAKTGKEKDKATEALEAAIKKLAKAERKKLKAAKARKAANSAAKTAEAELALLCG
jgi:hypothetical protein